MNETGKERKCWLFNGIQNHSCREWQGKKTFRKEDVTLKWVTGNSKKSEPKHQKEEETQRPGSRIQTFLWQRKNLDPLHKVHQSPSNAESHRKISLENAVQLIKLDRHH